MGKQFVEQDGLADATQPVENPAAVTFAKLLSSPADDLEGIENRLAPSKEWGTSTGSRTVWIGDRIHL